MQMYRVLSVVSVALAAVCLGRAAGEWVSERGKEGGAGVQARRYSELFSQLHETLCWRNTSLRLNIAMVWVSRCKKVLGRTCIIQSRPSTSDLGVTDHLELWVSITFWW